MSLVYLIEVQTNESLNMMLNELVYRKLNVKPYSKDGSVLNCLHYFESLYDKRPNMENEKKN